MGLDVSGSPRRAAFDALDMSAISQTRGDARQVRNFEQRDRPRRSKRRRDHGTHATVADATNAEERAVSYFSTAQSQRK